MSPGRLKGRRLKGDVRSPGGQVGPGKIDKL